MIASSTPRRVALSAAALAFAVPRFASADEYSKVLAEQLFTSGRALLEAGQVGVACEKLAESQRIDPAGGTALLLGICLEQQGKLASAWAALRSARAMGVRDGRQDRVAVADEHLQGIEPRIAHVTVTVPSEALVPGLEVSLDGVQLGDASRGTPLPVDPGPHDLRATAPGHRSSATTIVVPPGPGDTRATVQPLPADRSEPRTVPLVMVGTVGVLALGATAYFGVAAISAENGKPTRCVSTDSSCLDRAGSAESQRATYATVATVAGGVAAAAAVGELLLWLLPHSAQRRDEAWTVGPFATAGASLTARF
jgi:hypothetical protein